MRKIFIIVFLLTCVILNAPCQVPENVIEYPEFIGTSNSLENHLYKKFIDRKNSLENECETSFGLIEFYIDETGKPNSITIPPNFSNEITTTINSIIHSSKWKPMKVNGKECVSTVLFLPLFISIETGCKENDIKKGFGLNTDFMRMVSFREEKMRNCLLLKPISYVVSSGFQDINPKR